MDFFGFHPLYVVILLALALIIFGPSRLPKMGAQVGRMLREFQAAREGLTQQMREAFEEEPNFGHSTGPTVAVAEEESASEPAESTEGAVAVADRPLGETIAAGIMDSPAEEATSGGEEGANASPGSAAGQSIPEIDLAEVAAAKSPPDETISDLEPAATVGSTDGETSIEEQQLPLAAAMPDPPQVMAPEDSEVAATALDGAAAQGAVPEGTVTGGVGVEAPASGGVGVDAPAAAPCSVQPGAEPSDHVTGATTEPPGTVAQAPAGDTETPPVPAGGASFASVASDHEGAHQAGDEEPRPD